MCAPSLKTTPYHRRPSPDRASVVPVGMRTSREAREEDVPGPAELAHAGLRGVVGADDPALQVLEAVARGGRRERAEQLHLSRLVERLPGSLVTRGGFEIERFDGAQEQA